MKCSLVLVGVVLGLNLEKVDYLNLSNWISVLTVGG